MSLSVFFVSLQRRLAQPFFNWLEKSAGRDGWPILKNYSV